MYESIIFFENINVEVIWMLLNEIKIESCDTLKSVLISKLCLNSETRILPTSIECLFLILLITHNPHPRKNVQWFKSEASLIWGIKVKTEKFSMRRQYFKTFRPYAKLNLWDSLFSLQCLYPHLEAVIAMLKYRGNV